MEISLERIMEAVEDESECLGFCTECGTEAYGVEPDARAYECEECGAHSVYGAEELLIIMGGIVPPR